MSGIVGIFRRRGGSLDPTILQSLTKFLEYRGPDSRGVWSDGGAVGFGHTMLRTISEATGERQPASLDGRLWITADARIDCRSELIEDLQRDGRRVDLDAPDPELILAAYDTWGDRCVQRLRGDFAFAIWDAARKKLFCARDHFGIKPFFYATKEAVFLFSNTLNCLRMHPEISDELNEAAIGDFLLFGLNCDKATTTFREIQRLPPAHFMTVSASDLRMERYWVPPLDGRIRYKRAQEYVEHFRETLDASVADRLRTDRVGILLSGGLDSGAVAATARGLSIASQGAKDLRAYTISFQSLFQDNEGVYARETAKHLQIPIQMLPAGRFQPFEGWQGADAASPEPSDNPFTSDVRGTFKAFGSDCRAILSGEGADNLMDFQMWPYAKDLFRRRKGGPLAVAIVHFLFVRRFPWRGLRQRLKQAARVGEGHAFPRWLAADFVKRAGLADRWRSSPFLGPMVHPVLPRAHASLALPQWAHLFENADPGVTRVPVEIRYPFLDLRVVNYLLALPAFPWSFNKTLLRRGMASSLPKSVLVRAKTPLPAHPLAEVLRRPESSWLDSVALEDEMKRYVAPRELLPLKNFKNAEEAYVLIRPLCLNFWLQSSRRVRYNLMVDVRNA